MLLLYPCVCVVFFWLRPGVERGLGVCMWLAYHPLFPFYCVLKYLHNENEAFPYNTHWHTHTLDTCIYECVPHKTHCFWGLCVFDLWTLLCSFVAAVADPQLHIWHDILYSIANYDLLRDYGQSCVPVCVCVYVIVCLKGTINWTMTKMFVYILLLIGTDIFIHKLHTICMLRAGHEVFGSKTNHFSII